MVILENVKILKYENYLMLLIIVIVRIVCLCFLYI